MAVADFMEKLRADEEMALLLCFWFCLETNKAEYSVVTLPAWGRRNFLMVVVVVKVFQFNCSCW